MSLREQLLKAGLVSAEQVKKAETEVRKQTHQVKKDKTVAAAEAARQQEKQQWLAAEAERKRERDRQLNLEREAERKRREQAARAQQLLDSNRLNRPEAEIRYNFPHKDRYKFVRVTEEQQRQLARGQLAIARNPKDKYDFPLVSRETALKLAELSPDLVLLLYPEGSGNEADEWDWGAEEPAS